jgi:hypothetical protein
MKEQSAVEIAQDALLWLASNPEAFGGFLGVSGAGPGDVSEGRNDPEFLGFVLDYLLMSDEMVLDFSAHASIEPTLPAAARAALPGGGQPNWT